MNEEPVWVREQVTTLRGQLMKLEERLAQAEFGWDKANEQRERWLTRALQAEARCAQLREALASTMVPDGTGGLHHHDCVGVHGYPCKAWCGETRDLLDSTAVSEKP
jgi:hypothetical protein